jgi:hypothetical protein
MALKIGDIFDKYSALIQFIGGVIATAVTITVYAFTTFSTKEEVRSSTENIYRNENEIIIRIEKRLDNIEEKIDRLMKK